MLTSYGIIDSLLCFLDSQSEFVHLRSHIVSSMIEHESMLKVTHSIQNFSFLIQTLVVCFVLI